VRRDEHLRHLAQVPLFGACSKKDLTAVARASDEIDVPAGKVLVEEGRFGHEFFLILDGQAEVTRGGRRLATLGPGQYFGELALLDKGPRSATVRASAPSTVLVIGHQELTTLLDSVPGLARKLLVAMAGRLREADARAIGH
jgi:CRP/FNR family transcriptional regulator, cyclic AMP receptor protein